MSHLPVIETPIEHDPAPAEALYRVPLDAPVGQELFPVMAVLLAQILDLDQTTKESSL